VASASEAEVVVSAARELARSKLGRGRRSGSQEVYSGLRERFRVFSWNGAPWDALTELAAIEADLGHHDEAESLLRRLRREGPPNLQGPGHLLLGRIAVTRQEPWAEEILDEAMDNGLDPADAVRMACLRVERALRNQRTDEARTWLERARAGVRAVAIRPLQALVALAEGDTIRAEQRLAEARTLYNRGLTLLDKRDEPEVRHRLHLRLGDVALAEGHPQEAESHYLAAAQGFARHELPVREGWALLRLARVTAEPGQFLSAARARFIAADLAAGLAALDAITGDPGASLSWHLERATLHAKSRHDAQRSRPPWGRADADRPERRLGAHRLAIAACGEEIVHAVSREMDASDRAMAGGRARALDRPVLQYIAAVDLLSAHRSYEAAQALLRHLLRRSVEGPARRALQGAIARSPNAALVDGLLSVVEHPGEHPAPAIAEAAELLGLRRETAATQALCRVADAGSNPIARKAAVVALGRIGDRSVVDRIVPALEVPALAEAAALSLLMLGDRRGVDFHGQALSDGRRDLSGSPGEIVGRYGGVSYLLLLMNAAEGSDPGALGALQGLGLMGDPRGTHPPQRPFRA
jgi:tetratricopeptide (TPR) repeat protein